MQLFIFGSPVGFPRFSTDEFCFMNILILAFLLVQCSVDFIRRMLRRLLLEAFNPGNRFNEVNGKC